MTTQAYLLYHNVLFVCYIVRIDNNSKLVNAWMGDHDYLPVDLGKMFLSSGTSLIREFGLHKMSERRF